MPKFEAEIADCRKLLAAIERLDNTNSTDHAIVSKSLYLATIANDLFNRTYENFHRKS